MLLDFPYRNVAKMFKLCDFHKVGYSYEYISWCCHSYFDLSKATQSWTWLTDLLQKSSVPAVWLSFAPANVSYQPQADCWTECSSLSGKLSNCLGLKLVFHPSVTVTASFQWKISDMLQLALFFQSKHSLLQQWCRNDFGLRPKWKHAAVFLVR